MFGGEAVVSTLYGNVLCKIRKGMQSGTKIRLKGKGIVSKKEPSVHGDQYVTVQIQVPRSLSPEAERKLQGVPGSVRRARADGLTGGCSRMKCAMTCGMTCRCSRGCRMRMSGTWNELRLKEGFVMIGVLQQTQPPAVLPEAFLFCGKLRGEACFGKAPRGSARELTDRKDRDYEDWDWE